MKELIKKISSVEVMQKIYLDTVRLPEHKPVRVETGFISISKLGAMTTIWATLGNKTLPHDRLYTVDKALDVITSYMVMKDYEKVMNLYYNASPAVFKSPMVLGSDKSAKGFIILDGNHRACALWKTHKDKKVEFQIPAVVFYFKKIKPVTKKAI